MSSAQRRILIRLPLILTIILLPLAGVTFHQLHWQMHGLALLIPIIAFGSYWVVDRIFARSRARHHHPV